MKKLLVSVLLVAGLSAIAQNFESYSFLAVRSIAVTNLAGFTNIICDGVYRSNSLTPLTWTNSAGTRVSAATGTATETAKLVKDVPLYPDRNGNYPVVFFDYGTNASASSLQTWQPANQSVYVRLVGQSGANTATTFVFVPVVDGENGLESANAADAWTFTVTPSTTTIQTLVTNIPIYKWHGCYGLRLKSITAGDTDASSKVDILNLSLNGFRP